MEENEWGKEQEQTQYRYDMPDEQKNDRPVQNGMAVKITKCAAIALVFGIVAGGSFQGVRYFFDWALEEETQESIQPERPAASLNRAQAPDTETAAQALSVSGGLTDVSFIADNVMPAIVAITNMSEVTYRTWFGQERNFESESAGSGIIVSQDEDYLGRIM